MTVRRIRTVDGKVVARLAPLAMGGPPTRRGTVTPIDAFDVPLGSEVIVEDPHGQCRCVLRKINGANYQLDILEHLVIDKDGRAIRGTLKP